MFRTDDRNYRTTTNGGRDIRLNIAFFFDRGMLASR
jgi:hypothetical protein